VKWLSEHYSELSPLVSFMKFDANKLWDDCTWFDLDLNHQYSDSLNANDNDRSWRPTVTGLSSNSFRFRRAFRLRSGWTLQIDAIHTDAVNRFRHLSANRQSGALWEHLSIGATIESKEYSR
jgi:hypothetical protein